MNPPATPAVRPRHAATMIVLREHDDDIEVLMARRHADLPFMGGLWVFPGGALSPADQSDAARALIGGSISFELHDSNGERLPESICTALAIAACRETFEETGVLLARRASGQPADAAQLGRLRSERAVLAKDPARFVAALERESLRLDVDRLIYWAHWITPSSVSRRFDTRFFVARAPMLHELFADTYETAECAWMSPRALLEAAERGAMRLAQPTRYTLVDLNESIGRHGTLDALLSGEAHREVAPIMPKMVNENGKTMIVMPWHAQYAATPGEGVRPGQRYEPALTALASKIIRDV